MAHLRVPQNQALRVCRGFVPDIQVYGTYGREDLVRATITPNAEEEDALNQPGQEHFNPENLSPENSLDEIKRVCGSSNQQVSIVNQISFKYISNFVRQLVHMFLLSCIPVTLNHGHTLVSKCGVQLYIYHQTKSEPNWSKNAPMHANGKSYFLCGQWKG